MENSLAVPHSFRHRVTLRLNHSTPRYIPKKVKVQIYTKICAHMFIALIVRVKKLKQMSFNQQMNKQMWYIYTVKYILAITRNEY